MAGVDSHHTVAIKDAMLLPPAKEPMMRRLEDDYREEEIVKIREWMEQLRQNQRANKEKAQQLYEEMKQRHPEFWKAFGFATVDDYLTFYGLHDLINP
jgi:isocitrate lyase